MKINHERKPQVLAVLKHIKTIMQADRDVYKTIDLEREFGFGGNPNRECWAFWDYNNILDSIYIMMVEETNDDINDMFDCPGAPRGKPIAWYRTNNNTLFTQAISAPNLKYTGYIPDNIDDIILNHDTWNASTKYDMLIIMFEDLVRLKTKFEERSQNETIIRQNISPNTINGTDAVTYTFSGNFERVISV